MDVTMEKWMKFRFSKFHSWKIKTGDDNWFIDCGMEENSEANAERIVKAVNCHDDLVEALKLTKRLLDRPYCDAWYYSVDATGKTGLGDIIDKALAEAL